MKLTCSLLEIQKMSPIVFNNYIYGINIYKPQSDEIGDYMFPEDGEGWFIYLNRRKEIHFIPHKTYLRNKEHNFESELDSIIENNEKAGQIIQPEKNSSTVFIYLNTNDYKKVFEEAKQLHKWGVEICDNNENNYRWSFFMPDNLIEDSMLLNLLNDPRVYTEAMKKSLKIPVM